MAPLVRTGGSRHTGLAALPHRNIQKGVKYREIPAGKLLSRNLLVYGLGGLIAPFIFVKLIDMLLVLFGFA